MSVLNQSGEEQVECPLCMEPLEVDDLNFFPCTCGYQICRFCWHRIRTDENGLCPACRKAYSENPADFTPLSQEQLAKLKADKRQRDQQRKARVNENRKHLANVRVVQRNLVFAVGLPLRLADAEILKKNDFFGKFGKIHKIVINQSTTYAGAQGPSASAYVTFMRSDDALRAIQKVNNAIYDGRTIKCSLGTTKYCSNFLKNQPCPKPDCMYLHDFGDPEASFTKEEMHAGKHQEYERKLHEAMLQRTNTTAMSSSTSIPFPTTTSSTTIPTEQAKPTTSTTIIPPKNNDTPPPPNTTTTNKDNWPQLTDKQVENKEKKTDKDKTTAKTKAKILKENRKEKKISDISSQSNINLHNSKLDNKDSKSKDTVTNDDNTTKLSILNDNSSFFSHNSFQKVATNPQGGGDQEEESNIQTHENLLTDSLDITSSENWEEAFGFAKKDLITTNTSTNYFHTSSSDTLKNAYSVNKFQENIMDALQKNNGFINNSKPVVSPPEQSYSSSNLDHMSKFFMDFQQKNGQKNSYSSGGPINGMNGYGHSGLNCYFNNPEKALVTQQKRLEEELLNLSLKNSYSIDTTFGHYHNGDLGQQNGYTGHAYHGAAFQPSQLSKQNSRPRSEDELDFDPFQETQKGLAELIAKEQNFNPHNAGGQSSSSDILQAFLQQRSPSINNCVRNNGSTNQMNGIVHSGKGHLPPPPPGFVQPTTHMNSFGSKFLPFLNMSNNQQMSQNPNWPSYNTQQIQPLQHKNISSDWKELDSSIVASSRHYPLNMPPIRDHFTSLPQQLGGQQIPNGLRSSHEYTTNNTFSSFTQQLQQQQPNFNSFSHLNTTQPNINWFTSDINSQISSPPGFRNTNQTSKQQEC